MKLAAMTVGLLSLAGTIVPPAMFMIQSMGGGLDGLAGVSLDSVKAIMLTSAITWFAAAPFWMKVH